MYVQMQFLAQLEQSKDQLTRDGWRLQQRAGNEYLAEHEAAPSENMARQRLAKLGLLTSQNLRIEFVTSSRLVAS